MEINLQRKCLLPWIIISDISTQEWVKFHLEINIKGLLTVSRFGKFATCGVTLGSCQEYNDTNTIFGEIVSSLEILDLFVYKTFHYHDGSALLKIGEMEILNNPFEMVCKKIRRELVLGISEKEEKAKKKKEAYKKKSSGEYVKHKSKILDQLLYGKARGDYSMQKKK
jgi:hypothetical protein